MINDLLRSLGQFKSNMEYRNVDFNADKTKQYEAVRDAMARKYCAIDVSFFGPETTSPIPEEIEESEKEELLNIVKNEKAIIKKGYSRVMEKIKELRQRFSNAVTAGSRSGSGKLVMEFYDTMVQIWGGSPSTEPLSFGIESSEGQGMQPDGGSGSDTTTDTSVGADQLSEERNTSSDEQSTSQQKRPTKSKASGPVVHLIDNKRRHMERQLSSAKRDQILIDEAREDNNSRKELADTLLQSNQVFVESMQL